MDTSKQKETMRLLQKIFLQPRSVHDVKVSIQRLLNREEGIDWDFTQLYTPLNDGQDQKPQGAAHYTPELRWDWNEDGRLGDNNHVSGVDGLYLRFRYFWAIQTLTRILVKDVYGQDQINPFVRKSQSYNQFKAKGLQYFSAYAALGYIHQFYCLHHRLDFIAWHIPFSKLFQNWLKLADHANLLFSEEELLTFKHYSKSKDVFFYKDPNNIQSSIDQATKDQIRAKFQTNPHFFPDFSLPLWKQEHFQNEAVSFRQAHVPVPDEFYTKYTPYFDYRVMYDSETPFKKLKAYSPISQLQKFNRMYRIQDILQGCLFASGRPSGQPTVDLQNIHDSIHVGLQLPMQNPLYAAFDCIFHLHHANMDRLRQIKIKKYFSNFSPEEKPIIRAELLSRYNLVDEGIKLQKILQNFNYNNIKNSEWPLVPFARTIDRTSSPHFNSTFYRSQIWVDAEFQQYRTNCMIFQQFIPRILLRSVPNSEAEQLQQEPQKIFFDLYIDRAKLRSSYTIAIYAIDQDSVAEFEKQVSINSKLLWNEDNVKFRHHVDKKWNIIHKEHIFTTGPLCQNCKLSRPSNQRIEAFNKHNIKVDSTKIVKYVYVSSEKGFKYRSLKNPIGLSIQRVIDQQYPTFELLKNIFLRKRTDQSMRGHLLSLLNLQDGIQWDFSQVYTPLNDENDQLPVGVEHYQPEPRWAWNEDGQLDNTGNPRGVNGQYLRFRYFWALETMTRILVRDIYNNGTDNKFIFQNTAYVNFKIKHPDLKHFSVYSALGYVHRFFCTHGNPQFIGWHVGYLKAFENWLKLADHINLIFDDPEIVNFTHYDQSGKIYFFQDLQNPSSALDPQIKQQIRNIAKQDANYFPDFSAPTWIQQRIIIKEGVGSPILDQFDNKYAHFVSQGLFEFDSNQVWAHNTSNIEIGAIDSYRECYLRNQVLDGTILKSKTPSLSSDLQNPHNIVHLEMGGLMPRNANAGFDPIFHLHHAHIDRMRLFKILKYYENGGKYEDLVQQYNTFIHDGFAQQILNSFNYYPNGQFIDNSLYPLVPFAKKIDRSNNQAFNNSFHRGVILLRNKLDYSSKCMNFYLAKFQNLRETVPLMIHNGQIQDAYFKVIYDRSTIEGSYTIFIYKLLEGKEQVFNQQVQKNQYQSLLKQSAFRNHTEDWNLIHKHHIFTGGRSCQACLKTKPTVDFIKAFNLHGIPVTASTKIAYLFQSERGNKRYLTRTKPEGLSIQRLNVIRIYTQVKQSR